MGGAPDISPDPDGERRRVVLLVEDEILARAPIAGYLRDVGFTVIEAGTAEEAKAVFASGTRVDIVFADVRLPGGTDGFTLADWVKETHPHVPVLVTSGSFSLRAPGAVVGRHFIPKPYIFYRVESRLRELLAEKDAPAG